MGGRLCGQSAFPAIRIYGVPRPDVAGVEPWGWVCSFEIPLGGVAAVPDVAGGLDRTLEGWRSGRHRRNTVFRVTGSAMIGG